MRRSSGLRCDEKDSERSRMGDGALRTVNGRNGRRRKSNDVKTRLRTRAAGNGRSMEEEARLILREAVGREAEPKNLAAFIHECFAPYGGVELELPPRGTMREPPRVD